MFKVILCVLVAAVSGYCASVAACADSKCLAPFVHDTLLDSSDAINANFTFVKDSGEVLGVAAVKLQLNGACPIPYFVGEYNFRWWNGPGYYATSNSGYDEIDGYHFIDASTYVTNSMSVSRSGADTLEFLGKMKFYPRSDVTDAGLPSVGDTLNWQLDFIYFHGSKMDIRRWVNGRGSPLEEGDTISWVGSDTVSVRYRTVMRDSKISMGLPRMIQMSDAQALGRYDLQGRPLDVSALPLGLNLERTKQGFRKRLQLR